MSIFDKLCGDGSEDTEEIPERRTPRESEDELTAPYVEKGFRTQVSTCTDEYGNITEVAWGTKGSRRPDAIYMNGDTIEIVEVKNYSVGKETGRNNLVNNVARQTEYSIRSYGEDVKVTEIIDLRGHDVTLEDLDKLTTALEEKVPKADLDYRW